MFKPKRVHILHWTIRSYLQFSKMQVNETDRTKFAYFACSVDSSWIVLHVNGIASLLQDLYYRVQYKKARLLSKFSFAKKIINLAIVLQVCFKKFFGSHVAVFGALWKRVLNVGKAIWAIRFKIQGTHIPVKNHSSRFMSVCHWQASQLRWYYLIATVQLVRSVF